MGATALMSVSVFAPASIGNVNVGFDVLGLAVKPVDGTLLGDVVTVTHSNDGDQIEVIGAFANKLPSDVKQNIVWHCLLLFNKELLVNEQTIAEVKITLDKRMPVGSGLGSSACSVVAAIAGLNAFYEKYHQFSFSEQALLKMMGQMEAQISGSLHYDNVAPCFLGGMQLMVPNPDIITRNLPQFDDCYFVMAYPGIEVSTKAAREILPASYSRADLISFGQNLATFVDACHRGDKNQAFSVLTDIVAEPYRKSILPGYSDAASYLTQEGCLAVGISGSGPTLFCVTDDEEKAKEFANWLNENYLQTSASGKSEGFVHICQADTQGAVSLPE
ncbi:homoserine kinase [Colwellia sp. Arc7-D]|jgi:homoserine kinase|uniref:homoserine kinase n=1 Tax=Colwellia sp. Arc7-D TaxID=2161872 RepID=UPI001EF19AD4|nr:homoserine kinase [Colwellia sp. Arc7-D]|tara:strand:- start:93 stop:1088 length:996 start_codon:yes stop_codon:yes gene_type:complete